MASFSQHRPVTLARRGMVAAPHYLAAEAGLDILKTGGNAIDAAFYCSHSSLPANRNTYHHSHDPCSRASNGCWIISGYSS